MNYIERNLKPYIDYDYYLNRIMTGMYFYNFKVIKLSRKCI